MSTVPRAYNREFAILSTVPKVYSHEFAVMSTVPKLALYISSKNDSVPLHLTSSNLDNVVGPSDGGPMSSVRGRQPLSPNGTKPYKLTLSTKQVLVKC